MTTTSNLLRLQTVARDDYLDSLWAKGRVYCAEGREKSEAVGYCKEQIGADLEAFEMFMGGFEEAKEALLRAKLDLSTVEILRIFQGAFNDAPMVDEREGGGEHWIGVSFTEDTFQELEKAFGRGMNLTFSAYGGYPILRITNTLDAVDFGVCRVCSFKPR